MYVHAFFYSSFAGSQTQSLLYVPTIKSLCFIGSIRPGCRPGTMAGLSSTRHRHRRHHIGNNGSFEARFLISVEESYGELNNNF